MITATTLLAAALALHSPEGIKGVQLAHQSQNGAAAHSPIPIPHSESELTLALIKPDAVAAHHVGEIITELERAGFVIVAMKMIQMTKEKAQEFYSPHKERPFYPSLVQFMSSGPVVAIVLEGDDAIARYRTMMGATSNAAKGTLRGTFATSIEANAVHGSDSAESAQREIPLLFTPQELHKTGL